MKDKHIECIASVLCPEYGLGCEHCSMSNPESECSCTIEEDCENLIDAVFRLERYSCWVFDEYEDCIVCNNCHGKALADLEALADPDVADPVLLSDYCPYCGSKMNIKEKHYDMGNH